MSAVALIPIKRLESSKTRLSAVLSPSERRELVLWMFERVLKSLCVTEGIAAVHVTTDDPTVVAVSRRCGANIVPEMGFDLNSTLAGAVECLVSEGASTVLVLPGDIPLVEPFELSELLAAGLQGYGVLAPAKDGIGTNAIVMHRQRLIPLSFGGASFTRHKWLFERRRYPHTVCRSSGIAFDVDTPEDLSRLRSLVRFD